MRFKKGYIPWNKGLTKETDERVRKNAEATSKGSIGKILSMEHRKKISEKWSGKNNPMYGKKRLDVSRRNRNPKFIKKILKALHKRPTKLERKLIKLIEKNKLPFKYVGDGEFILGGKCPDFLNCNGEKQVIEIFGRVFHDPEKSFRKHIPYHQTEQGRIEHFKRYGFACLIVWEEELNQPDMVIKKIRIFGDDS